MAPQVNAQATALLFDAGAGNNAPQVVVVDDLNQVIIDDNAQIPVN